MHTDKEIISIASSETPPPHEAPSNIIHITVELAHLDFQDMKSKYTVVFQRRVGGSPGWDPIEILRY